MQGAYGKVASVARPTAVYSTHVALMEFVHKHLLTGVLFLGVMVWGQGNAPQTLVMGKLWVRVVLAKTVKN